ncbi:LysR family transcriptional regulator [Fertoebacter nigrum]|uniref:LysR family transcriptional regulator n=1 Tax=Fertoeibacter niger TaxID=2656921 RepID=A0A8X8KR22_9RHOB|nr:LysR family transcriptional regulator [Fertoeibacter niger]NUB46596.1 LysR family transcriptional regulator [Fertoeibacter niger]
MNLRSLDLNLLVILDALLDEAHVSRAADRLNLSQPAASAALQRCRHLFRDDLLERGRGTMRLTAKAEALRAPLKSLLAGIGDLVDPAEPILEDLRQTLRLSMADLPAMLVTGPLLQALQSTAPGIDLILQPWHGAEAAASALIAGTTDIAISVFSGAQDDIHQQNLLTEHFVVALRQGHPAIAGFDLDRWLAFPHVLVSGKGEARSPFDTELARIGRTRRIGLVVPSFAMVPALLHETDMIALLPSRLVAIRPDLISLPVPIPVAGFPLHLGWHRRRARDLGLRHVALLLAQLLT